MENSTFLRRFTSIKTIVAAIALAIIQPAQAQTFRLLENVTDEQGLEYNLAAMALSSNHRYVAGQAVCLADGLSGIFVYDLETGNYAIEPSANEMGGDVRGVDNNGVAAGFNPLALTFSIDGTKTELETPAGYESGARDISDDGKVVVGCYWNTADYYSHACVWKDGKLIRLPEPTTGEMGFQVNGTSANYCSADGSVIAGYIVDNMIAYPLIIWRLQDDGTYVCDPVCKDYFGMYEEDSDKPYILFRAVNISRNGRYAAINITRLGSEKRMACIDLETNEVREFIADGTGKLEAGTQTQALAVADDGTLTGYIQTIGAYSALSKACIWRTGASEPEIISEMYPQFPELASYDNVGFHLLYDITPDGTHALGYAYDENFNFATYVLTFDDEVTGISAVTPDTAAGGKTEVYTLDGRRLETPVKGINIIKHADGTTEKVLVK